MCIAIYKPKGVVLSEEALRNSFTSNRDGAGFAYVEESVGEVCLEKGYWEFDDFLKAYEPHAEKQCLVHFRVATHKAVNGLNCHPWRVDDNLVFIHNGTISNMSKDDDLSDTGNFNKHILQPMMEQYPEFYLTPEFKWLVENAISDWNKLIFLDSKGNHLIVHENKGVWDSGCWFSNHSYKNSLSKYRPAAKVGEEFSLIYTPTTNFNSSSSTNSTAGTAKIGSGVSTPFNADDDSIDASTLEAQLAGREQRFFNSVEELDRALEAANAKPVSSTN